MQKTEAGRETSNVKREARKELHPMEEKVFGLTGYRREDFAVCLGCKICASVCTVNDLAVNVNPQELLLKLFMGDAIEKNHPLVCYCTNCYRCTGACPWNIRIPEVVRALRENLLVASPFEKAFKGSIGIWGRVYEPYVFLKAVPFLLKEGYVKYMAKWTEYISIHLPHKVKIRHSLNSSNGSNGSKGRSL